MGFFKKKDNADNYDDYYDDQGFFVGDKNWQKQNNNPSYTSSYDGYDINIKEESDKKQSGSIIVLTLVFLYMVFLILGMISTTFEKGYIPQIINVEVRSQRAVYNSIEPIITFISQADTFNGMTELSGSLTGEIVSSRIVELKLLSKEVDDYKSDLEKITLKVKDDDPMKLEMLQITDALLISMGDLNTQAISYYEAITGYSSLEDPEVIEMQNIILNTYNTHQNRLMEANDRIDQIKQYVLLIE